nr:uncharacterized protein LOC117281568 [Nicotiana tomentosiformis]
MAVESETAECYSIFALMAKYDDDEDNDDDEGAVKGSSQKWYMDSGCSKHMTGSIDDFLSLKALQGESVSFGNGKKRYILGIQNIYVADFDSLQNGDLTCLNVVDDNAELWHRRLGHVIFTLLNKFVKKDLVRGLPKCQASKITRCMIRSLMNKTPYELLNGRKPKLTHLRTFGCKYSHDKIDQGGEQSTVLGEVIDMANGKAYTMGHVKESNDDNAAVSPSDAEEPSSSITTTEAENIVVDVVQGTPDAELRSGTQVNNGSHSKEPRPSHNEFQVSKWKHKNARSAFLNGFLKEEVFVKQPPGFECREHLENAFKLDKALYGLKQAPRACEFEMSMMRELNFFLGLQVKKTPKGTMISQQKYIKELLKRFEMESSKIIDTLIATTTRLDMDVPGPPVNETMYRGIIGSLLYLTTSRPNIIFSVGLCVRFQSNPKESYLKAAKRILRNIKGMQDLVLYYPSRDNFNLIGYADADYASYLVDRKSTSGMAHFLGSCLISWGTTKQNSVSLSTAEAEYVVATS